MTMMKTIPHCDSCDDEEGDDAYMYILDLRSFTHKYFQYLLTMLMQYEDSSEDYYLTTISINYYLLKYLATLIFTKFLNMTIMSDHCCDNSVSLLCFSCTIKFLISL